MSPQKVIVWLVLVLQVLGKMTVQSPPELVEYFNSKYPNTQSVPYSIANFGLIPYGKIISGEIGVPQFLEDCIYEEIPPNARKNIMLVERNDCSFTQKSINVQKEGGKLAIIMDNIVEKSEEIVMSDDGKGHFVTIPTVFIGKEDGEKILEFIDHHPIISVAFELKLKERSDVTLWIDVLDHANYIFLRNFQAYYIQLATSINFEVAYPTNKCSQGCIENNCYYGGKYCRYPHGFRGVENGGQEVMREQLRQYVLFKESPSKWWDYMLRFDDKCNDLATFEECSGQIMSEVGASGKSITKSVDESFAADQNTILRDFSEQKYSNSILYYPSIVINSIVYRGNLQPSEVYQTICQSMTPTPEGCGASSSQTNTHLTSWIVFGVVSVVLFALFLIVCFRRVARRQLSMEMNKKVNELVNEYISMYEVEKFKQGEGEQGSRG